MRIAALMLAALALSAAATQAAAAPTLHIERQRGTVLTIEHTPARVVVRRGVRRAKVGLHRRAIVRRKVTRARTAIVRRKVRRTRLVRGSEFVRNPAIAGGCYDGGFVRERVGRTRVTLQREVCEGIAPNLPKPEVDSVVKILRLR